MRFSRPLHRIALATGLSALVAGHRAARRILMLHGVGDEHMPVGDFERVIAWLASHMRVVPLAAMVDDLSEGRPPPSGGELAITFDDGLRNQLEHAYPVLERHEMPATFFVCPGLIDEGRWIWNHEARSRLEMMAPAARADFASGSGEPTSDVEAIVARMKGQPIHVRWRHEAELKSRTPDFIPSAEGRRRYEPLAWSDFDRIDPALVAIGSHTLNHPILTSLDDSTLQREIAESRSVLEKRLGRTVDLFCYPNGSMDQRVRAVVARSYRAAVTTEYGFVGRKADLHRLHRIPATPSLPLTAWRMHRPTA